MVRKKIEFHEEASREYEAAFGWYFERSELAASKFAEELERAISNIAKAPGRWPEGIGGREKSAWSDSLLSSCIENFPLILKS